jgi:hypothetical protein
MALYGGIDLHANNSVIVLLNEQDKVIYRKRLSNDLPTILEQLAPYHTEIQGLVVESTYNWYWLADGLMEAAYRVHLANPAAMQQYSGLKYTDDRRFSRCGIDSHSSLSASAFSRNTDALCEGIFRPRGPKATLLLTGPHRLIVSRGSAELPGRRVQWLSALPRDNGKNTSHWSLRVPGTASRTCMPL